ncbi:MAG: hypothetical protein R3F20_02435 [Planctomycetota bacterium]
MEQFLPIILVTAVMAVTIWIAVGVARKRQRRIEELWRHLAEHFGGEFVPSKRAFWSGKSMRAEVEVGGVPVVLDSYVVSHGKSSTTYSRASAPAPTPHRLEVSRSHLFTAVGRALGMQDHLIGDEVYDEAFTIKGDDPEWVAAILDEPLRRAHLAQDRLKLQIKDGQARTIRVGFEDDLGVLIERIQLTAALALAAKAVAP